MRFEDLEYINYKDILDAIDSVSSPTRASIAKYLNLSRTTVSNVITRLIDYGVVEEIEVEIKETRGRPGLVLNFTKDKWFSLGADFSGKDWVIVLCNLDGSVVDTLVMPEIKQFTPESMFESLFKGLDIIEKRNKGKILPAIGLGLHGVIDSDNGDIMFSNVTGWHERIKVSSVVEEHTGMKVYCTNRYIASGIAEYKYSNPDNEKNMIFFGAGGGFRSAIFTSGNLLEGASYTSGRVAHLVVDPNGKQCDCGKRGCLLTVADEKSLIENAKALRDSGKYQDCRLTVVPDEDYSAILICSYADNGDRLAIDAVDSIAPPIAKAISMLVDIVNPRRIVIGGDIGYASRHLVNRVREEVKAISDVDSYKLLEIEQGNQKVASSARGAASLVLSHKAELLFKSIDK